MTKRTIRPWAPTIDIVALTALAWVTAAALHEGAGHGLACLAMGGEPLRWSTFHFACGQEDVSLWGRRIIAGAGSAVNLILLAIGWAWWRATASTWTSLAAWIVVVLNGLTSFGYLIFSAAFDIGDWNRTGVLLGVSDMGVARSLLAIVGLAGYAAVIRIAAHMLSRNVAASGIAMGTRQLTAIIWGTTGIVSLLAALMAGADWRSTAGASIGAALGGNAGLLTIGRFATPSLALPPLRLIASRSLWLVALVVVGAFVAILGPGGAL